MDPAAFEAALQQFPVVRARDFEGDTCREWSADEARRHRAEAAAAAAQLASKPVARRRGHGALGDAASSEAGFFDALGEELRAAEVNNVPEVLREFKDSYMKSLCELNLEELEGMLQA